MHCNSIEHHVTNYLNNYAQSGRRMVEQPIKHFVDLNVVTSIPKEWQSGTISSTQLAQLIRWKQVNIKQIIRCYLKTNIHVPDELRSKSCSMSLCSAAKVKVSFTTRYEHSLARQRQGLSVHKYMIMCHILSCCCLHVTSPLQYTSCQWDHCNDCGQWRADWFNVLRPTQHKMGLSDMSFLANLLA